MNEKGNRYALAALKGKRAAIASEVVQLERQLRHRRDMLIHVDATLRLLDPSIEVDSIPTKRTPQRIRLFRQGELGRMILDAVRRSPHGSVGTAEIVTALLSTGGHGEEARKAVAGRVRGNLAYLQRRGRIIKIGDGRSAAWALPDACSA